MLRTYPYRSSLQPYIEGLIMQKRANGYNYEFEAYLYTKFDEYCFDNSLTENSLTREALAGWMALRDCESKGYHGQRISFVRQLLLYMNSLGITTYIPRDFSAREKNIPHIMSDEEIQAFFPKLIRTDLPHVRPLVLWREYIPHILGWLRNIK